MGGVASLYSSSVIVGPPLMTQLLGVFSAEGALIRLPGAALFFAKGSPASAWSSSGAPCAPGSAVRLGNRAPARDHFAAALALARNAAERRFLKKRLGACEGPST
jgi:hypothetical protein